LCLGNQAQLNAGTWVSGFEQTGIRCTFAMDALTNRSIAISLLLSPPSELSRCINPAGHDGPDRHLVGRRRTHRGAISSCGRPLSRHARHPRRSTVRSASVQ